MAWHSEVYIGLAANNNITRRGRFRRYPEICWPRRQFVVSGISTPGTIYIWRLCQFTESSALQVLSLDVFFYRLSHANACKPSGLNDFRNRFLCDDAAVIATTVYHLFSTAIQTSLVSQLRKMSYVVPKDICTYLYLWLYQSRKWNRRNPLTTRDSYHLQQLSVRFSKHVAGKELLTYTTAKTC